MTEHELAAEALDLGEMLFDTLLKEATANGATTNGLTIDLVEARSATDEFFVALRLLLGLDGDRA